MQEINRRMRIALSYILTVVLVAGFPAATFAETIADPETGTAPTAPAEPQPNYTYDSASGRWNSDKWHYDANSGQYGPVSTPGPLSPTGPTVTPGPTETTVPASDSTVVETPNGTTTQDPSTPAAANNSQPVSVGSGASTATDTTKNNSTTNSSTNNTITNNLGSNATSGDAAVTTNTTAGSATSGGAAVAQTVINTINSSVSGNSGNGVANFVADITGDVYGDMILSPMMLGAMLSNAVLQPTTTTTANSNTNASTNNQIVNDINLDATSGNADVTGNTNAGSATTGPAHAVANVMNIINSIIAANQSFVGTVNIYGNLDGDILIAPDFLPQLLASNASSSQNTQGSLNVNVNDTQAITNNVNLSAASGAATVAGNTTAGNATTGSADTNLTILNLTGHEVVASNSMLVFVNVLGKWVGVIVDAPAGATAAVIGSDVTQNKVADANASINAQTNTQITNNVNVAAQSGDASVTRNTNAGDATSGNATASANILNMSQSSFGVSGWFGILFINVFGQWFGNFADNSARGDSQELVAATPAQPVMPVSETPQAVAFVPKPPTPTPAPVLVPAPVQRIAPEQPVMSVVDPVEVAAVSQPLAVESDRQPIAVGTQASSSIPPTTGTSAAGMSPSAGIAIMGAALMIVSALRIVWPLIAKRLGGLV